MSKSSTKPLTGKDDWSAQRLKTVLRNNSERAYRFIVSSLYDPTKDGEPQNSLEEMIYDLYSEFKSPDTAVNQGESTVKTQIAQTLVRIHSAGATMLLERLHGRPIQTIADEDGNKLEKFTFFIQTSPNAPAASRQVSFQAEDTDGSGRPEQTH